MKNTALRFVVVFICLGIFQPAVAESKVVVGYFSTETIDHFEKNVKPLFEEFKGACTACEIVNLTPYDDKGVYSEKDLLEKIKNDSSDVVFYLFDWNKVVKDQNRAFSASLSEKISKGKLILATTGHAAPGEAGAPLSRTVFGQTKDAIIIGEITGRERLLPQSYFGPEMLTALSVPKEHEGKGVSPLYFAARWAAVWMKKSPSDWLTHFKEKKVKNRKIFLSINDLLSR
ncbi:MAG: hypothetical protein IPM97_01985 [Bdellovibrionaceae bacterium]|nr:hypothetical protein [Pseudobdellovibrionaceae bacterium]